MWSQVNVNKLFLKLSLIILSTACMNTSIHAVDIGEKPSSNQSIQRISNGDFKYFYKYGELDLGVKTFGYLGSNKYEFYIEYKDNRLQRLSVTQNTFYTYSSSHIINLTCEKIYKDPKYCDVKNIYQQDHISEKYPELRKNDSVDVEAVVKSKLNLKGIYHDDFELFIEIVALHLKVNHFSDDFIQHLIIAAKEDQKHPPTEEELSKLKKEVFELLGISEE